MRTQYLLSGFIAAAAAISLNGPAQATPSSGIRTEDPAPSLTAVDPATDVAVDPATGTAADPATAVDPDAELRRWAEEAEASDADADPHGGSGEIIELTGAAPDQGSPVDYQLGRDQLRALPGTGNDALRAIQSLPGVARVPYGLGGLILRGTSPRDSKVYLDGIEVPSAFHFAAVAAVVPSSMLDGISMVPGGGDAAYGRSVGGHVEVSSRAPRRDRWRGGAELGLIDAQASLEGPTAGGGAFLAGLRRSYIDAMLGPVVADENQHLLPRYWDGQVRWDQPLAGGTLTATGFFSSDRAVTGATRIGSRFARGALRYTRRWNLTTGNALAWVGRDHLDVTGSFPDGSSTNLARDTIPVGLRADVVRDTGWGQLAAGIDGLGGHIGSRRWVSTADGWMDHVAAGRSYVDAGAWAEARWRIAGGRLNLKPGARLDHYDLTDEWVADPRLVVSHELGAVTLREMLGVYHQPPSPSDLELADRARDRRSTRGVHASIGAEARLAHGVKASLTGFHVQLAHVAVADIQAGPRLRLELTSGGGLGALARELVDDQLSTYVYQRSVGRGRTWGSEMSLEKKSGRWMGWVAYTLARAERTDDPAKNPGWHPYSFDQTHNLSAVGSVELGAWRVGARFRYASGNPRMATPALSLSAPAPGAAPATEPAPTDDRLPGFVSLDARVDRSWRRGWGTVSAFVDLQNVTNAENAEDIIVDGEGEHRVRGLPLFPSFGLSYQPSN